MKQFFRDHPEYKIMHSHIDAMSFLPLLTGKIAGVPIRIAHSHNTAIDRDFKYLLKQLFRLGITKVANYFVACGEEAGRFLFAGRPFQVIPNAIDAEQFLFDDMVRTKKRLELDVEDKFVVGHIGRMSYQKNHSFLLDIFGEIVKKCENAVLVLVGVGEKEEEIRQKVENMKLTDRVTFLGKRSDIKELYQAMDVFVLPSLFEGVPVVGIEAQFSGLPCVFSDKVPQEVAISQRCRFVSLEKTPDEWAEEVLRQNVQDRSLVECSADYDIKHAHTILTEYYDALSESVNKELE